MPSLLKDEPLLILDGACGTTLQDMIIPVSVWDGHDGCNEYLNISSPETIVQMHSLFLKAGAMAVETNTFGANSLVLAEYGLADRVEEINRAAVQNAKSAIAECAADSRPRYVLGSIGPTTKLPSLGHIPPEELAESISSQIVTLVEAGVDGLIIETCQDLLQVKTVLVACFEILERLESQIPVLCSVTFEPQGTMLLGTDIAAVCTTLAPFPLFSLGLNCATGPADMEPHINYLSQNWPHRISCVPNQGMPEVVNGQTAYPLTPEAYSQHMLKLIREDGVSIVGGCCGTSPEHIKTLVQTVSHLEPGKRKQPDKESKSGTLASLFQSTDITQEIPPLIVGERSNPTGSKTFRTLLQADDFNGCLQVGMDQEQKGAHIIDLNVAWAGRNEKDDMIKLIQLYGKSIKAPVMIDSTTPEVVEAALLHYPGRPVINSINLEDGGDNLDKLCLLAKKHGACLTALTIDEQGMAMTTDKKLAIAHRIYDLVTHKHQLQPEDLFFDPLTFTIGSGDKNLETAAIETLNGIKEIKKQLPGCQTILGLSNISFGLPKPARKVLNAVFLHEAVAAGLDAVIIDPSNCIPLEQIDQDSLNLALDLIYNKMHPDNQKPLMTYIKHFETIGDITQEDDKNEEKEPEQLLNHKIIQGNRQGLEDLLQILMDRYTPLEIVNQILVPGMKTVGTLFGDGQMLLPFVLQSAEVMRTCVDYLEPFMDKNIESDAPAVVLATVRGDVHDIGKNLVNIILSNNGCTVHDLGIKVDETTIIEAVKTHKTDIICLSGLLVKSAIIMQESMPRFAGAELKIPILLGGAALTRKFVAQQCAPNYPGPVVYCKDAFAGLNAIQEHEQSALVSTTWKEKDSSNTRSEQTKIHSSVKPVAVIPKSPFMGAKTLQINPADFLDKINRQTLFRGRWKYNRAKMSEKEYSQLLGETVEPEFKRIQQLVLSDKLLKPQIRYGWFSCRKNGDGLAVQCEEKKENDKKIFQFGRQQRSPFLSLADYFSEDIDDLIGFFLVTLGEEIGNACQKLYKQNKYHDYLLLHGYSVEAAEALAHHAHDMMLDQLGISTGQRYSFGYSACPDLDMQKPLFALLQGEKIGIHLTSGMEMDPEQSVSAMVVHHPEAHYFSVSS